MNSKTFCFLFSICLILSYLTKGQDTISKNATALSDSLRIKHYYKVLSETPLFSYKRQLYLDSLIHIKPDVASLWQQKAMPLFKQKKYELGMQYLDSAVKYDHSTHWLEYRAFIKCIFQKSYKESIKDFELLRVQNGSSGVMDHSYDFYMGLCYLQMNDFENAEKYIQLSIDASINRIKEGHYIEYFYLGVVKMEKEEHENAIANFDQALKVYKHFSDAKYYKASCLIQLNKQDEALPILIEAKQDVNDGYTINEDSAIYEEYPYQIKKRWPGYLIDKLSKKDNK
jgi:tetratricopeptide (TPR) repeat protein